MKITLSPVTQISAKDLDILMSTLDVNFLTLTKCFVSEGYGLQLGNFPAPGIHYNIAGYGRAIAGNFPPIDLAPHTMVIVPPNTRFRIEVPGPGTERLTIVDSSDVQTNTDGINSFIAGNTAPEITLICGFFNDGLRPGRPAYRRQSGEGRCFKSFCIYATVYQHRGATANGGPSRPPDAAGVKTAENRRPFHGRDHS